MVEPSKRPRIPDFFPPFCDYTVDGKFDDITDSVLEAIENSSDEEEIDLATASS